MSKTTEIVKVLDVRECMYVWGTITECVIRSITLVMFNEDAKQRTRYSFNAKVDNRKPIHDMAHAIVGDTLELTIVDGDIIISL